jgi:hypothetical protein
MVERLEYANGAAARRGGAYVALVTLNGCTTCLYAYAYWQFVRDHHFIQSYHACFCGPLLILAQGVLSLLGILSFGDLHVRHWWDPLPWLSMAAPVIFVVLLLTWSHWN